jgi:hypothetical protein
MGQEQHMQPGDPEKRKDDPAWGSGKMSLRERIREEFKYLAPCLSITDDRNKQGNSFPTDSKFSQQNTYNKAGYQEENRATSFDHSFT